MLNESIVKDSKLFKMKVQIERTISIRFFDIFSYLTEKTSIKKIVFIDPVVLFNQPEFLKIETSDSNMVLVPTNLHESNKDFDSLLSILSVMESNSIGRRDDLVIAVGGGALLDAVSLAASIFRRGISVVKVPTTLLGIVDASIGIKTGINYLGQRNRVGSYHIDFSVLIDTKLMKGLHKGLIRQGLGEIFKIAIIKSRSLYDQIVANYSLLENVNFYQTPEGLELLRLSILLMLEELHENPREDNLKRCVDFGHSFSPLVEMASLSRSGVQSLPHGYSVSFDCLLTSTISWKRGLLSDEHYQEIFHLYSSFDFCLTNDIYRDCNLLWASFVEMTKHRGGNQNLPIPTSIGSFDFLQDVSYSEVQTCSTSLLNSLVS